MESLQAVYFNDIDSNAPMQVVKLKMDQLQPIPLQFTPWATYPYKPLVIFSIAHNGNAILVQFQVDEQAIRAVNTEINSPVYEDSCVEFFIGFNKGREYYNIEFNCIGASTVGYGKGKQDRLLLPEDVIRKIRWQLTLGNDQDKKIIHWTLTLVIPAAIFIYDDIISLKDRSCHVNFYKCGDLLPEPHFVSWSDIKSAEPNFHLPEFFGKLLFH